MRGKGERRYSPLPCDTRFLPLPENGCTIFSRDRNSIPNADLAKFPNRKGMICENPRDWFDSRRHLGGIERRFSTHGGSNAYPAAPR